MSKGDGERYAFGRFVLERRQRRVLDAEGGGPPLNLTPRLFSALLLLVEHAGELLDKDTMMRTLWPGLVVEENNLSQVIAGLRRALGDEAQGSRFIQTVPRHGFRFVAPVTVLPEAAAVAPAAAPASRRHWIGAALLLATAGGAGAWWAARRPPAAGPAMTLAVLPFKPIDGMGRDTLLEVGMADSLIARLSLVPGLVVRSTGSILRYAGAEQDPLRAARELDVAWILDGSLQRRGDQFRATARLLRAADGQAQWSGRFDETVASVFELQDQISRRVVQALAPALQQAGAPADPGGPGGEVGGTRSTEAYQLYLTATWRAMAMREEDIQRAIALFHQALAIDAGYALAWTGLAWAHRRRLWIDAPPSEVEAPSSAALARALALVPRLAQALTGRAVLRYMYAYDWSGAERGFREALAINPNVPNAHQSLGQLLLGQGRIDEGMAFMRRACELDPMSPIANTLEASYLVELGQLELARLRLSRALDIAPRLWLAHVAQGQLLLAERQLAPGLAALRRAAEFGENSSRPQAVLAARLAEQGQADEARAILERLKQQARSRFVPPTSLAAIHAALGDTEAALGALEQAVAVHDSRVLYMRHDANYRSLHRQPRFIALMERLGLAGYERGLTPV